MSHGYDHLYSRTNELSERVASLEAAQNPVQESEPASDDSKELAEIKRLIVTAKAQGLNAEIVIEAIHGVYITGEYKAPPPLDTSRWTEEDWAAVIEQLGASTAALLR